MYNCYIKLLCLLTGNCDGQLLQSITDIYITVTLGYCDPVQIIVTIG